MSIDKSVIAAAEAAQVAKRQLRLLGWDLEELNIDQLTGWARVRVSRIDGDHKRLVTLMRSAHGGRVVERREVGVRRASFYSGDWWDFSESLLLGTARREGFRSGLRLLARYIDDNRGAGSLQHASAKEALRPIATAALEAEQ